MKKILLFIILPIMLGCATITTHTGQRGSYNPCSDAGWTANWCLAVQQMLGTNKLASTGGKDLKAGF